MNVNRWRADHVGSLLRPAELLQARQEGMSGGELAHLEDECILRVLAKQKDLGLEIFTDGEFRRSTFMSDFTDCVSGFDLDDAVDRPWETSQGNAPVTRIAGIVRARLKKLRPLTLHELDFLEKNCPGAMKMTLPSATQFPAISFKRGVTDKVYSNYSELLWDIVEIVRQETAALASRAVDYVQIDAPRYSYYIDPKWREWIRQEMGLDPDATLDEALKADNACFEAARRPGTTLAIHLCRGNNRSHWYAEGGYDAIAEKLFSTLAVDRFLLEYDDERSGTFEPLRFVPRGKTVVLGLVSSKRPELENRAALISKIKAASKYVPTEDLALSPQCGFASTMEGNLLTEDEQWAKLKLVADTAREIWG
jgi:5-methyltetrahydropteroyltriglutamate--homocysteine methyltransferase